MSKQNSKWTRRQFLKAAGLTAAGTVKAAQVVNLNSAKTVEGDSVAIKVVDGKVYVNDAQVIQTDIQASNGVIHVIDTVLLPAS